MLRRASLAAALDAPAEEVEALVDVDDARLGFRQAQAHGGEDRRDFVPGALRRASRVPLTMTTKSSAYRTKR